MKSDQLVPDALMLQLIKGVVLKSGGSKFILDGYPRTLDQASQFEKTVGNFFFTLETSGEDVNKLTLETSGKDVKLHSKRV